jgi:hypothetical protein
LVYPLETNNIFIFGCVNKIFSLGIPLIFLMNIDALFEALNFLSIDAIIFSKFANLSMIEVEPNFHSNIIIMELFELFEPRVDLFYIVVLDVTTMSML